MEKRGQTVYLAMSGGVDSSVSAALLRERGFHVVGVFIRGWYPPHIPCTWSEDRRDAMRVATMLGMPFKTYDAEEAYRKSVVRYLINEYKAGRTPNPDVMCNKHIKFGEFFRRARRDGADCIATGHHARAKKRRGYTALLAGADPEKDQSYFLWTLGQEQLARTLFPVGDRLKSEVRKVARQYGLPTAEKKDSQGLCFIGELDMKEFLERYIKTRPGEVVDTRGRAIGGHRGAELYTIGERRGFDITVKDSASQPFYVVGKNVRRNRIIVSHDEPHSPLYRSEACLARVNWISGRAPERTARLSARIRYREPLSGAHLTHRSGKTCVRFKKPRRGVALGQSCVIYRGEECLGGGVIV